MILEPIYSTWFGRYFVSCPLTTHLDCHQKKSWGLNLPGTKLWLSEAGTNSSYHLVPNSLKANSVIPNLNEPLILSINFTQKHQLGYCTKNHSFALEGQPNWGIDQLKVCNNTMVPSLSVAYLMASIHTKSNTIPGEDNFCISNIASSQPPLVKEATFLQPDSLVQVKITVKNCSL